MMNRSDFRNLVNFYVEYEAQPYIVASDTTDLNTLINDRLAIYSGMAKAFYDDMIVATIPVATSPGPQRLNTRDGSVFGQMIWEPTGMIVNGKVLLDEDGKPGGTSALQLQQWEPDYITEQPTTPYKWYTVPSTSGVDIVLWPPSDQSYPNSYAIGWTMHPALTADSGTGGVTLLPQELERGAAKFTAAALLDPTKAGSSLSRWQTLMREAQDDARAWAEKAERMIGADRTRGVRSGIQRIGGYW